MSFDLARLDRAVDWAIAEDAKGADSKWDQGNWAKATPCGTSCCLAGNIVIEAGYKPIFTTWVFKDGLTANTAESADGRNVEIGEAALSELGFGPVDWDNYDDLRDDVSRIFDGDNDILAIKQSRDYIASLIGEPARFGFGDLDFEEIEDLLIERRRENA